MTLDMAAKEVNCCPGVTVCRKAIWAEELHLVRQAGQEVLIWGVLLAASAKIDQHRESAWWGMNAETLQRWTMPRKCCLKDISASEENARVSTGHIIEARREKASETEEQLKIASVYN